MTPRTSRVQVPQSGLPQVRQKATAAISLWVEQFIRTSCAWSPTLQADPDLTDPDSTSPDLTDPDSTDQRQMDPEERRPEQHDCRSGYSCAPASARAVVLCRPCGLSLPVRIRRRHVRTSQAR